jgi:hypothetical protein
MHRRAGTETSELRRPETKENCEGGLYIRFETDQAAIAEFLWPSTTAIST